MSETTPHDRAARNVALAVTAIGTLALELFTLHAWAKVFTGAWLGDYVLSSVGERLLLVGVMAVYALAGAGIFLALFTPLLRLVFRVGIVE